MPCTRSRVDREGIIWRLRAQREALESAHPVGVVDLVRASTTTIFRSIAGKIRGVGVQGRVLLAVIGHEWVHLRRHIRWELWYCLRHLLRTSSKILKLVVESITHRGVLVVEISVCVEGIAKWSRDCLRALSMCLLSVRLASLLTIVTCSSATVQRLDSQRGSWGLERGRIDGRHPDASLVDFEQVGDQVVEIDVVVGKVVEGELLAIPTDCQYHGVTPTSFSLTSGIRHRESPCSADAQLPSVDRLV
jgi:hypothetical protein